MFYFYKMDYKKKLIQIFTDVPAMKKEDLAASIGMDPGNFRRYVSNNETVVTEKTYDKIMSAIVKHHTDLTEALKK